MGNPAIDYPWNKAHVTAAGAVCAHPCVLHNIVNNGLTTVGDVTVYDGIDATGDIIAVLHLDTATSVSIQPITLSYDCEMTNGIYIAFDGTVACDLTVTYK